MKYLHIKEGIFMARPNRFIAHVSVDGQMRVCHVKNTGRCRELLLPGCRVILEFHPDAAALGRNTEYSLIGVYKETADGCLLINMDSQVPNQAAAEWLHSPECIPGIGFLPEAVRREVTFGQSRFDLYFEGSDGCCRRKAFMEVKGVTLEDGGIARFPDAPTERGIKHIHELIHAVKEGYSAFLLFVIQMAPIKEFQPNIATHPEFGAALKEAAASGVTVLAYDCLVAENSLSIHASVPVNLL